MKFSIITVVYNNVRCIGGCIKSVLSQSYKDIEYIIVDGSSTDGTMDVVNRYGNEIDMAVSEKDEGNIYAMNKGLNLATGDVVGFLHSDDYYTHDKVIESVAGVFKSEGCDSVYGDLVYVKGDDTGRAIRHWRSGEYDVKRIRAGWMPPHPAFFVKRNAYDRFGKFDTSLRISSDYELILRFLYKNGISAAYLPGVLVEMRWGGVSNRSLKNIVKKTAEDYRACRMHGLGMGTVFMKNITKIPQFLPTTSG